jgi:hypothetical protein
LSVVTLRTIKIRGGEVGLAAYQKKPEFGGARLQVSDLEMIDSPIPFLVQEESTVIVDDEVIHAYHPEAMAFLESIE